jgi:hypothetical protein
MSTKTTGRSTGTFLLGLGCLLAVGGVVLAVAAAQVSYGVTRQREGTCNGLIPMPTSVFELGWAAVAVALLATVTVLIGRRAREAVHLSAMLYDSGLALLGVGAAVVLVIVLLVGITTGALLLAGAGAIVLVGAVVAARRQSHRVHSATSEAQHPGAARTLFMVLLTATVVALLFDGFVLSTVYDDAPTKAHVCSG